MEKNCTCNCKNRKNVNKEKSKLKKIILINLAIITIIIIAIESILYAITMQQYKNDKIKPSYNLFKGGFKYQEEKIYFRKPCGLNYKKAPIIIYGCSFAYGGQIEENEHIGYILSKLTKRPVYNFGMSGIGLQYALNVIQNQEKIEPKPEFLIYVFVNDQARRMYMKCFDLFPIDILEYVEKDGKFIPQKNYFAFLKNTLIYQNLYYNFVYKKKTDDEKFELMKKYLYYIKKEAEEKYPGIKFVFINYDGKVKEYIDLNEERLNEIRKMDIDVIDIESKFDLRKKEYHVSDSDSHPSAKAWREITPYIVKVEKM